MNKWVEIRIKEPQIDMHWAGHYATQKSNQSCQTRSFIGVYVCVCRRKNIYLLCILYLSISVCCAVFPCIYVSVFVRLLGNVSCELSRDLRRMTLISKMPLDRLRESEPRAGQEQGRTKEKSNRMYTRAYGRTAGVKRAVQSGRPENDTERKWHWK